MVWRMRITGFWNIEASQGYNSTGQGTVPDWRGGSSARFTGVFLLASRYAVVPMPVEDPFGGDRLSELVGRAAAIA